VSDHTISVTVNGVRHEADVESRTSLADLLRHGLALTGTHVACEHGVCGSCTVLLDGEPVRSCLMLAVQANGGDVETIEGVATDAGLHPLQQAFRETHAFQCGFCTPGFLMTALALLRETPSPSEREVREALAGNICRCTGYESIVRGVLRASS
jgi:carbon-monoxide dehydrogenase small subunit